MYVLNIYINFILDTILLFIYYINSNSILNIKLFLKYSNFQIRKSITVIIDY